MSPAANPVSLAHLWEVTINRGGRSLDYGPVRVRVDSSLDAEHTPDVVDRIALCLEAQAGVDSQTLRARLRASGRTA